MTLSRKEQRKKNRTTLFGVMSGFYDFVLMTLAVIVVAALIAAIVVARTMDESDKLLLNTLFFISLGSLVALVVGVLLQKRRYKVNN